MKKKIKIFMLVFALVLVLAIPSVFAYSTDDYSIDLPTGYESIGEGIFSDSENGMILITVETAEGEEANEEYFYSDESLQEAATVFENMFDKETLKEFFQIIAIEDLSDEDIENVTDMMSISLTKKEITTFTKNGYKCLHFVINYKLEDEDIITYDVYATLNNGKVYVIFTMPDGSVDSNIENAIKSFTINIEEKPQTEEENKVEEKPQTEEENKVEEDNTKAPGKLPQTGSLIAFETVATFLIVICGIFYIVNNKKN